MYIHLQALHHYQWHPDYKNDERWVCYLLWDGHQVLGPSAPLEIALSKAGNVLSGAFSTSPLRAIIRGITQEQIPEVIVADGVRVKIICGEIRGVKGPVQDVITDPEYLDVSMDPNSEFKHLIDNTHNVFAYVIRGEAIFDPRKDTMINSENLVIYRDGDEVVVKTKEKPVRFLLISGKPIGEPVAWRGPIVMNTEEELGIAFREYSQGTFIKHN